MNKRGRFIVIEGIDRSGKTTQSRILSTKDGFQYVRFPNRDTPTGKLIDDYLKGSVEMSPQVNHLLFSANRWESINEIESLLDSGINVVCDRYIYSGIAYSVAKGLDCSWCESSDMGLLQPDVVFYLDLPIEEASKRGEYGEEIFENEVFQRKVQEAYTKYVITSDWIILDATQNVEGISKIIENKLIIKK